MNSNCMYHALLHEFVDGFKRGPLFDDPDNEPVIQQ